MRVELADTAKLDIAEIQEYLSEHAPQFLESTLKRIQQGLRLVARMPRIGRSGIHAGVRQWSLSPLPYVIHYQVFDDFILVDHIRHAARLWPPAQDDE